MRRKLGKGRYGTRGRSVSIWLDGDRIVAQWREHGPRVKKSWDNTASNRDYVKAWAEAFAEARAQPARLAPITTADLWRLYAEHEFPTLRSKTQTLYRDYWRKWSVFVAPESIAEDFGPGTVAQFRAELERAGLAPNTIGKTIAVMKTVYAWGYRHQHLSRNDVREYRYKVAKENRRKRPGEYRREEFEAILQQLPMGRPRRGEPML